LFHALFLKVKAQKLAKKLEIWYHFAGYTAQKPLGGVHNEKFFKARYELGACDGDFDRSADGVAVGGCG